MKVKTSITISEEPLEVMNDFLGADQNRSLFLETAAWAYIAKLRRAQQDARRPIDSAASPLFPK